MIISQSEIGFYFKNGFFDSILESGKYYVSEGNVEIFNLFEKFEPKKIDIKIALTKSIIAQNLQVVQIKETEIGIRIENGKLKEILKAGSHVYWKNTTDFSRFEIYNLQMQIDPKIIDLNTFLEIEELKSITEYVEVKDNEICFHNQDGFFREIFRAGKFAFWKTLTKHSFQIFDITEPFVPENINKSLFFRPDFASFVQIFVVESFETGLLFINKNFETLLKPGIYFFWKKSKDIKIEKVDTRQQQIEINGQEIMSKDKVTLRFNFVCQFKIVDAKKIILEIKNYTNELYIMLQLVLREYVGGFTLDEILLKKQEIGEYITSNLKEKTITMGIDLIFAGVKDVILPGEIKEILNQVLIAEKKAQANVIMRREETASTRSLLNTAKLMEENEILYKLKELEYVERISEKITQISISGGTQILDQLKQLFLNEKNNKI